MNDTNFYKDLLPLQLPITAILYNHFFSPVPDTWVIVIADVKNSTVAMNNGQHNDVNLIAAGSLIAALNICKRRKVEIPFFFGGDSGSMIIPNELLKEVLAGLENHNLNCQKYFGLSMHIGYVSVANVLKAGHDVQIAKQRIDAYFHKPVIMGNGMQYAERQIKHTSNAEENTNTQKGNLDLTGLECRWDRVQPPTTEHIVVCYLIDALQHKEQLDIYRHILQQLENIFGSPESRNPLSKERLKLLLSFSRLKKEMLAKYGRWKVAYYFDALFRTMFGKISLRYNLKTSNLDMQEYIEELVSHADTLMIDGRINTIISGTPNQHNQFLDFLVEQEKAGQLIYGHYQNRESVITCYIEERKMKHIHFVDGADGGYTEAARELKSKLLSVSPSSVSMQRLNQ